MRTASIGPAVAALTLLAFPVFAQEAEPAGVQHETNLVVGEAPPTSFRLESIDGETHELSGVGARPLMLLFFRGTW